MKLDKWEPTVQRIFADVKQERRPTARQKVLKSWRGELEKEPTWLEPFQIDEIVREVRRRLDRSTS